MNQDRQPTQTSSIAAIDSNDEDKDEPSTPHAATPKATADQPHQPTDETPFEYSNEARTYHARYQALSEAHDEGRKNECREGCLDILTSPRLPLWTRIQILQMLSTLLQPAGAEDCLSEAAKLLDDIEKDTENEAWQTGVLRQDNNNMISDLTVWRQKKGLVGQSLEGRRWGIDDVPEG